MFSQLRSPTVLKLVECARCEAEQIKYKLVIEFSDRSEAAYLHLERNSTCFGYRLACHLPVYPCSTDYQQILVPWDAPATIHNHSARFLKRAMQIGGHVVANPAEVSECIKRIENQRLNEVRTNQEVLEGREPYTSNDVTKASFSKTHAFPRDIELKDNRLTHLERSSIRHRLNLIARWTFEELNSNQ